MRTLLAAVALAGLATASIAPASASAPPNAWGVFVRVNCSWIATIFSGRLGSLI